MTEPITRRVLIGGGLALAGGLLVGESAHAAPNKQGESGRMVRGNRA